MTKTIQIGDKLRAKKNIRYFMGQAKDDIIRRGEIVTVDSIRSGENTTSLLTTLTRAIWGEYPITDQRLFFKEHADRYGPWPASLFTKIYNKHTTRK